MGERNGTLTLALVLGAFLAGGFAHSRNLFPFPYLREVRERMTTPAIGCPLPIGFPIVTMSGLTP